MSAPMELTGVEKATKCCELRVYLRTGQWMTGLFHVSARTSSAIRPSDAIAEKENGLLLLSNVTLHENGAPRAIDAVIMPLGAVSHIELPAGWMSRNPQEAEREQPNDPVVEPPPSPPPKTSPPVRRRLAIPKWRGGT